VDTYSGSGGVDHRGDQNRAGRPNAAGRVARVSGICAARALSVVSGDLLRDSDDVRLCSGRRHGDYLHLLNLPCNASEENIKVSLNKIQREYSRKANVACILEERQKAEQMLKTLDKAQKILIGPEGKLRRIKFNTAKTSTKDKEYDNFLRFLKLPPNASERDIQNAIKEKERVLTDQAASQKIELRHQAETILEEIKTAYKILLGSEGQEIRKQRAEKKAINEEIENIQFDSISVAHAIEIIALKRGRKTQTREGTVLFKRSSFFLKGIDCFIEEIIHKKYEATKDLKLCVAQKGDLVLFEWECNTGRNLDSGIVRTFIKGQWVNDIIEGKLEIEIK